MFTLLAKLPWYFQILVVILFVGLILVGSNRWESYRYDKAVAAYEALDKVKEAKSTALKAHADLLDQKVAELEPKLAAYEALDVQKKKLDGTIATKIDAVIQEGKNEEANTDAAIDCGTRADRTCAKLVKLGVLTVADCPAYKRKICS